MQYKAQFVEMFGDKKIAKNIKKQWKDVVEIVNGKDHKKVSGSGNYAVYGTGGRMFDSKEYMCDEGTIIMGRKGTIDKPYIVSEKCWIVDTAFGVYPKNDELETLYLYYYCKNIDYNKLNKACTLPSVTKSDLLELWIDIPPKEVQQDFSSFVNRLDKSKFDITRLLLQIEIIKKELFS